MANLPILGTLERDYAQVSFAGGGLRCFWQGGALDALEKVQALDPTCVAAASGGALTAACFLGHRSGRLKDCFIAHLDRHDDNVDWHAAVDDGDMTHHQKLYRDVVAETLDDEAIARIADGPAFEVVLTRPPDSPTPAIASAAMLAAYELDKLVRGTPHTRLPEDLGAEAMRVDARAAARDGKLHELICHAATIPPLFDVEQWEDEPVMDSGSVDNAPLPSTDDGATLVLLTRSYRNLPEADGRTYVWPSEEVAVGKVDFTDSQALRETYEQGQRDMERLIEGRSASRFAL